jgi:hypothetical protein
MIVLLAGLPAAVCAQPAGQSTAEAGAPSRPLGAIDVGRLRELCHVAATLGDELWPGFSPCDVPIAVNNDDWQEMLVGHPEPPEVFRPFEDHELKGRPVLIRDGATRYGPKRGGWSIPLAGHETAYVSTLDVGSTERYIALLMHECFHVYQGRLDRPESGGAEPPEDDAAYSAMIRLESRVLHAALVADEAEEVRELAAMFVAVRRARREALDAEIVRAEDEGEFSEGTASYVTARMYRLLAERGGIEPVAAGADSLYGGFAGASERYEELVEGVLPPPDEPVTFFHAMYQHGMAQGLLLDRLRTGWKAELVDQGASLTTLLERAVAAETRTRRGLLAAAKERFDYGRLLEDESRMVAERLALIRGYLEAQGRRYRVHHGAILGGGFNWKPQGPVYRVPASLLSESDREAMVPGADGGTVSLGAADPILWLGGIQRLDRDGLVFASKRVPIVFRRDYLQWIDEDPDPEMGDLRLDHAGLDNGVYEQLSMTTDGFTLELRRARVELSDDLVEVFPVVDPP